jgi:hypothetical protein
MAQHWHQTKSAFTRPILKCVCAMRFCQYIFYVSNEHFPVKILCYIFVVRISGAFLLCVFAVHFAHTDADKVQIGHTENYTGFSLAPDLGCLNKW